VGLTWLKRRADAQGIARSLGPDSEVTLEQGLRELDLLKYCRSASERRRDD
jgi:hypothetical protein